VSQSLTLRATNRPAAAILAVESWRARGDALAESALLGTFTSAPGFLGTRVMPYSTVQGATIPGTRKAILASGSRIHVVDLETGTLGPAFDHSIADNKLMQVVRVSGDGRRVAQLIFDPASTDVCGGYERLEQDDGRGCTVLTVFDIASRRPVFGPVPTPFQGGDLAIDQRGRYVAVTGGFDGDLTTYDVDRGARLGRLPGLPRPEGVYNWRDTGAVTFDRSGRLYLGSMAGPVRVVDPRSLEVRQTLPAPPLSTHNFLAMTPRGLIGTGDDFVVAIDPHGRRLRWRVDIERDTESWPCPTAAVAPAMGRLYCGNFVGEIEERDLATGQLTGVRRDPQGGEVGDLSVAHGNELVAFGNRNGMSRWRLDGTGPVATMVVPRANTLAGYDESGRVVDVVPFGSWGPHRLVDLTTGENVGRLEAEGWASWVGDETIAIQSWDGQVLGHVGSDKLVRPDARAVQESDWLYPSHDPTTAWAAAPPGLREFDVRTGAVTGRVVRVRGGSPWFVRNTDAGQKLLVSLWEDVGEMSLDEERRWRVAMFDVDDGLASAVVRGFVAAAPETGGGVGPVVVADVTGAMHEVDPETMQPQAVLPGSVGAVEYMAFSDDGTRLLATGSNRVAQLFDSETWIRIGAIPADTPGTSIEGFLRPDGRAVLTNARLGVVEWNLDPDRMAEAACHLAGRNLTRAEWQTYFGDEPYRLTCPEFPASR
jgi:WD40 repeat protein